MDRIGEGMLIGIGNPLLDISAVVEKELLDKYQLKADDAIMASDVHKPLYKELEEKYKAEYIAGGSCQNSLRVCQWILNKPKVAVCYGCVGKDEYADMLRKRALEDGVDVQYQVTSAEPTGTCAVLITGTHRSLCANLAAATCFTPDHLEIPQNKKLIENAQIFYVTGYFIAVSVPSMLILAKQCISNKGTFILNLSAPFVSQFYKDGLAEVLPYVDILFGNETEMITFAKEHNFETNELQEIALKISTLPKQNEGQERVVVITQGCKPVILARKGVITEIPVVALPPSAIVDTNGAGDAFTGGFLSQLLLKQPLEVCVKCGIYAASKIIQSSGCTFSGSANFTS